MKYTARWQKREYDPRMDLMDFIRNNTFEDINIDEDYVRENIKWIMVELYKEFLEDNY